MFDQDCGTAVHVERGLNVHSLRRYFKLSKRDLFVIPVICLANKYILKCPGNCVQGVLLRPLQSRRRDRHDSLHGQRVLSLSPSTPSSSSSLENLNGSMVSHRWHPRPESIRCEMCAQPKLNNGTWDCTEVPIDHSQFMSNNCSFVENFIV